MELDNIEGALRRFDLISKRFIYGLKKEFIYGKDFKKLHKIQADSDTFNALRKQEKY